MSFGKDIERLISFGLRTFIVIACLFYAYAFLSCTWASETACECDDITSELIEIASESDASFFEDSEDLDIELTGNQFLLEEFEANPEMAPFEISNINEGE